MTAPICTIHAIGHIPELVKAGVDSLKIEGRAKTYYYTAVTTNAYRHAVDEYFDHADDPDYRLSPWIGEELEKISHRAYSTGFFFGEPGQETVNGGYIRRYNAVAVCEESSSADNVAVITQRNKFLVGDTLDILPPDGFSYEVKCLKLMNEDGEEVPSAPHPMQKLYMTADKPIAKGSVIRKKNA